MNEPSDLEWVTSISTAAAVIVALAGYAFLEWQRRQSVKLSRRTSAHMVGIRLFRIANASSGFEQHFVNYAVDHNEHSALSLLPPVHPLIGVRIDPIGRLERDEVGLLIEAKETRFLTELMLANAVYEAIVISLNEYRDRYETLYKMMPPPNAMNGKIGAHELTEAEILRLKPYSIQLFEIIDALRKMIAENVKRCTDLSIQYHPMMKKRFKGEKFISLGPPKPDGTS